MLKTILLILLSFYCFKSFGQLELKTYSSKAMQKDLKELMYILDGHPDPYTKISQEDFNAIIAEVKKNISVELDEIEFYKNLSKIVSSMGDGHSKVYLSRSWLTNMRKKNGAFPYEMYLSNDGDLFVIKSYGDNTIELGAQITEINGLTVDVFIEKITPYISFETTNFRNNTISESFELMLYLAFKQADGITFKYRVAKDAEAKVSTIPYKEYKKHKKDVKEVRDKKISIGLPYDFNIIKPGIAKIDIFSFSADIEKFDFFLNQTFKEIENNEIHSLIIDVRGNYGGWPKIASELFHYIHDSHFKTMAKSSMKISTPYRRNYTDLYPYIKLPEYKFPKQRHYVNLQEVVKGKIDTYSDEEIFFNEAPIKKKFEFSGDCYVLIDRKSYSAASSFASTFQCYSMGYLIGEETGGTKIFRANPFTTILPKTKFAVSMSTTKLYTACYNEENEPIIPNIEVTPSILDLIYNSDPHLNMAMRLIKKVQKEKSIEEK